MGPEPLTWIGTAERRRAGRAGSKASYPSRHFTTSTSDRRWGYRPMKTSDYVFGAARPVRPRRLRRRLHATALHPWTKMSPEQCNELFDRMGGVLNDAFTLRPAAGRQDVPRHGDAADRFPRRCGSGSRPRARTRPIRPWCRRSTKACSGGSCRRIRWTTTGSGRPKAGRGRRSKQQQIDATLADFRAAMAAAEKVKAPFTLATCGWVLGPPQDRALFDNVLPKEMPMSCINRQVGHAPVEPGFANVRAGRNGRSPGWRTTRP